MYKYLSTISADTDDVGITPLNVTPQNVLTEEGDKNQSVHIADDGSEERISLSDSSIYYVEMQWDLITESTASTIYDYFHDTEKGNGKVRSFPWVHPIDGYTYVVRFDSKLQKKSYRGRRRSIDAVRFRVLGIYNK